MHMKLHFVLVQRELFQHSQTDIVQDIDAVPGKLRKSFGETRAGRRLWPLRSMVEDLHVALFDGPLTPVKLSKTRKLHTGNQCGHCGVDRTSCWRFEHARLVLCNGGSASYHFNVDWLWGRAGNHSIFVVISFCIPILWNEFATTLYSPPFTSHTFTLPSHTFTFTSSALNCSLK